MTYYKRECGLYLPYPDYAPGISALGATVNESNKVALAEDHL